MNQIEPKTACRAHLRGAFFRVLSLMYLVLTFGIPLVLCSALWRETGARWQAFTVLVFPRGRICRGCRPSESSPQERDCFGEIPAGRLPSHLLPSTPLRHLLDCSVLLQANLLPRSDDSSAKKRHLSTLRIPRQSGVYDLSRHLDSRPPSAALWPRSLPIEQGYFGFEHRPA